MKKSTTRTFKKQHQKELKKARSQKRSPSKIIKAKDKGRLLLLGGLDKMIETVLKNTRSHDGVVNTAVVIVVFDALVKDTQSKNSIMYNFGPVLGPEVSSTTWALSDILG